MQGDCHNKFTWYNVTIFLVTRDERCWIVMMQGQACWVPGGLGPAICEEISLRHTLLPMEPEGREIEADDKGLSSRISQLRPIVQSIL